MAGWDVTASGRIMLILTRREAYGLWVLAQDAYTDTSDPAHRGPPELFQDKADRRAAERAYKALHQAVRPDDLTEPPKSG